MNRCYVTTLDSARSLQKTFADLEDCFINSMAAAPLQKTSLHSFPVISVFEQNDQLILIAEMPGVDKADINLQVHHDSVRISGKRTLSFGENANVQQLERYGGTFDRSFELAYQVDASKVQAEYKEGVLKVTLPRAEHDKPKQIEIK